MIRVLIVEDSNTQQELLKWILSADPEIEVVGLACDGLQAIEMTAKLNPDVITMDLNMPVMDGFEATRQIMIEQPTPILIVTASANVKEVSMAMTALSAGAVAVLPKPTTGTTQKQESTQLLRTIKAMAGMKLVRQRRTKKDQQVPAIRHRLTHGQRIRIVAFATSTGGPSALGTVLSALPPRFPVPILVVQHIAEGFTDGFAAWLNTMTTLQVKVARDGEPMNASAVYLAPEGQHLGVSPEMRVAIVREDANGGFRPSANVLFRELARHYGPDALAVVLTGMGSDGLDGIRSLRAAGGTVITQDEATSVIYGMPKVVNDEGLAHETLALPQIAPALIKLLMSGEEHERK